MCVILKEEYAVGGDGRLNIDLRSRATRLVILAVAVLLLLNFTLGFLLTRQASGLLISMVRGRMLDVSNTAAAMLDGDMLARLQAEDADSEDYQQVLRTLSYFQDNIELDYIYCIRDLGSKHFVFMIDPSEDPGEFGAPVVYTDALYAASLGTPAVDEVPYQDAWGSFYSAYTPVFTSSGAVGGIVAVDFNAAWFDTQVSNLVRTVVIVSLISLIFGILIVVIITRRNRARYRVLLAQLNELADKVQELVHEIESGAAPSASDREKISRNTEKLLQGEDLDAVGAKILTMQDDIRRHIERVHRQAYVDAPTGVGSKAAYLDTVRHLEHMIQEEFATFAVAIFDLNGLKMINDNYGHECGDLALLDTANALIGIFGAENIYRIGGDEFVAILKHDDDREMRPLFARLDDAVRDINREERPYKIPLAISKGASAYRPGEDPDYKTVFKRADMAMYEDKRAYYTKYGDRRKREPAAAEAAPAPAASSEEGGNIIRLRSS